MYLKIQMRAFVWSKWQGGTCMYFPYIAGIRGIWNIHKC